MKRREFITFVGGAVALPLAARAQQAGKVPTVGVLGTATPSSWKGWIGAFEQRLRELGWIEGRTVAFAYRWSEGDNERLSELAADFAKLMSDVIVTTGTGVPALRKAAPTIPIVFAIARDPVADRLVESLARPGGLVTGLSSQAADLSGKRLELVREIVPSARRIAVMAEINDPTSMLERSEVEATAHKLGLTTIALDVRHPDQDLTSNFQSLQGRADAVYCGGGGVITMKRTRIFAEALAARLPTISGQRTYAQAGSLISYGPDYSDLFRRAAEYVDRILRGAKAADLPVQQPTKFELTVNLKTAKVLGITVPPTLLARADEVIE